MSFHSLPELHVHPAMGDANVRYVEHLPIIDPLLRRSLTPDRGRVTAPVVPGHGIDWDPDAAAVYTVDA